MPDIIKAGTILIKDGTVLRADLLVESEMYAPNWKVVKSFDGYGLGREINEANWNFFYLAADIKATVLGREGQNTVRRAVKRILARLQGEKFNSLEITEVVSKRFLGVPYASVSAHSRHIQESLFLFRAKDLQELVPSRNDCRPDQSIGLARANELTLEEMKAAKCGNDLEPVIV